MTRLDSIRQVVVETFAELGDITPTSVVTTTEFRDQTFIGYRFRCEGMEAVWRENGNVVAFFDERGTLMRAVRTGPGQSAA
jgi:hypothetical protein